MSNPVTGTVPDDGNSGEFGANEWLVDEMYERYLVDKNSVDQSWWPILEAYHPVTDQTGAIPIVNPAVAPAEAPAPAPAPAAAPAAVADPSPTSEIPIVARTTNATAQTVSDAARKWLPEKDRVVCVVAPVKGAPIGGRVTKTSGAVRGGVK